MNFEQLFGRLLDLPQAENIERIDPPSLAAPWAHDAPAWLLFAAAGFVVLAVAFYTFFQPSRRRTAKIVLALFRAATLSLVILLLAEPVVTLHLSSRVRPALWLLFDGSQSMAIPDKLTPADRERLVDALGSQIGTASSDLPDPTADKVPRMAYVKALLRKEEDNPLVALAKEFDIKAFLLDKADGEVRALKLTEDDNPGDGSKIEPALVADALTTDAEVTNLGGALADLSRRRMGENLAGVVVVSDFWANYSVPGSIEAAKRLGAPIFAVGVGPTQVVDLAVSMKAPPVFKKDEEAKLLVSLTSQGLADREVSVTLRGQWRGENGPEEPFAIDTKSATLSDAQQTVDFTFRPDRQGSLTFLAEVEPLPDESVDQNNLAQADAKVVDDAIRLLYVAYEPGYEWRFIKEVFHRDKLVGMEGFRTFLASADPRVRQTKEMFLPALTQKRSEFLANDVIILDDMPAEALTPQFCALTREFVDEFGGGLVVLAGPRFGPRQLTVPPASGIARPGEEPIHPLADMLPVVIDPKSRRRDCPPFRLKRTPSAELEEFEFMRLGAENEKAWANLGPLVWYQPSLRLRSGGIALAEHPAHTCVDGKTRQPLIAIRWFGKGEVIYLAFNETWRLRRKYGERYYRQFWAQMIHRLAMSHALGQGKRFRVECGKQRYRDGVDQYARVSVQAYDADFQELSQEDLLKGTLEAELILPEAAARDGQTRRTLTIPQVRKGLFETQVPLRGVGQYRVRVTDPVTGEKVEEGFEVTQVSEERQHADRNESVQKSLAAETGGKAFDLAQLPSLAAEIPAEVKTESSIEIVVLWHTWLAFGVFVFLLICEWLGRKWVNLP